MPKLSRLHRISSFLLKRFCRGSNGKTTRHHWHTINRCKLKIDVISWFVYCLSKSRRLLTSMTKHRRSFVWNEYLRDCVCVFVCAREMYKLVIKKVQSVVRRHLQLKMDDLFSARHDSQPSYASLRLSEWLLPSSISWWHRV